jgi:Spy/CpxP family protein refolding chaperone
MKTKWVVAICTVVMAGMLQAQNTPPPSGEPAPPPHPHVKGGRVMIRPEGGKWWQNSEIASKLQLTDAQTAQLNQVFFDHKMHLIDYGAEMEKQDLKLQTLLDADQPNEGQVSSQVDQVLAARGKLEREFTMMNLDLRKVLSLDQWRQLKAVRGDVGGPGTRIMMFKKQFGGSVGTGPEGGDTFYFRQFHSDGGGEDLPPLPPPDLD